MPVAAPTRAANRSVVCLDFAYLEEIRDEADQARGAQREAPCAKARRPVEEFVLAKIDADVAVAVRSEVAAAAAAAVAEASIEQLELHEGHSHLHFVPGQRHKRPVSVALGCLKTFPFGFSCERTISAEVWYQNCSLRRTDFGSRENQARRRSLGRGGNWCKRRSIERAPSRRHHQEARQKEL